MGFDGSHRAYDVIWPPNLWRLSSINGTFSSHVRLPESFLQVETRLLVSGVYHRHSLGRSRHEKGGFATNQLAHGLRVGWPQNYSTDLHLVLFSYANLCSISFTCLSHFPSRVYHKRQIRTHHMWPLAVIFKLGVPLYPGNGKSPINGGKIVGRSSKTWGDFPTAFDTGGYTSELLVSLQDGAPQ